jgi:uncharacterized membrane protein YhaH (DUF805 family)
MQQDYRLVGGLITQVTSLTVLWYMMCRKGRRWKDIGWKGAVLGKAGLDELERQV